MKKFFNYLKSRPVAAASLFCLALLYFVMLFAEFFAPYSPVSSFSDKSYHPPNARFYKGRLSAQEWRVTNTVTWRYARIRDHYSSLNFFGRGEPYKLWGLIPAQRHFITTEPDQYPLFLMGTDNLGRDIFSRIIYGSRISLTIGFAATFISLVLAALAGGFSGYFGGAADWSIMRVCEFLMLIPTLYLILFLRSLMAANMDPGKSYMMITIILSLVGWPGSARTIRGMVHAIKREEFVLNAKLEMIPPVKIIFNHIIPQIASLLIISVALSIPGFIMTETVLSYLGLGITDPAVSWGSLIKRDLSTLSNLRAFPWLLSPVWFLLGVTLAFNFIGDALRDFFDPYHAVFSKRIKLLKRGSRRPCPRKRAPEARRMERENRNMFEPSFSGVGVKNFKENILIKSGDKNEIELSGLESNVLLRVGDLRVTFNVLRGRDYIDVYAVRGVSFSLNRGECLGIVGESGSGKSVSTLAIPGLLPKNADVSGSILYGGKELLGLGAEELRDYRGKKIGMIFQEPGRSYDPLQSMGGVFWETFRNSEPSITRDESDKRAAALLDETGLDNGKDRLSNFPQQFSGGQLQRIGIALALAQGCELLIADEPTTALDLTIQKQIIELLKALRKKRELTVIFISHDIELVAEISDRIMVMYGGLLMESAPVGDIIENPRHPYTQALLAASPRFGSHYSKEKLITIPGKTLDPAEPNPGCPFAMRCEKMTRDCLASIPEIKTVGLGNNGQTREIRCNIT